ncbi:MAG: nucleotidyltransferase domain-containing protein [Planctomycetota bacterium]
MRKGAPVDHEAVAAVCREFDLVLALLFGSRSQGRERADSDSDLAVLQRAGVVPAGRFLELGFRLGEATGLPDVDLVDLRRAAPLLRHQAASHGTSLYEAEPGRFNLFRVEAWRLWLDDALTLRRLDVRYVRESLDRLRT